MSTGTDPEQPGRDRPVPGADAYREAPADRSPDREPETAPSPAAPPAETGHAGAGRSGAAWTGLVLAVIVLILLLVFILQNDAPTPFSYLGADFTLPLGVAMLLAAIAGAIVTMLIAAVRILILRRQVRRLEKERATITRALHG